MKSYVAQLMVLLLTHFMDSTTSKVMIERSTNELELNKFLPALINSFSDLAHVILVELDDDLKGVNYQELATIFHEDNNQISLYSSVEKWIQDSKKILAQTNTLKLVFGRFESLKKFLQIIWDNTLLSYSQKYIFITDTNSFNQLIKLKKVQDVFHLLILPIDNVLNTGFFYLYTPDPIHNGEYIRLGAWITRFISIHLDKRIDRKWSLIEKIIHYLEISEEIFPNKFLDMKGKVFNCAYVPMFPYTIEEEHSKSSDRKVRGVDDDILSQIQRALNFNIKYIKSIDGKYGIKNQTNYQFNGMIGMAQRQEVDFCIGGILRSYEREKVIDFSSGTFFAKTSFLTRKPIPFPKWQAIFSPFQTSLWVALILTILSYFVICFLFLKFTSIRINEITLTYSSLNIWASFMNQGITHPERSSYRVLLATWFLFSVCIVSSYAGSLFSSLTVPQYEEAIDSPNQLIDSNLKILVLKGAYHEDLFKNSNVKLYQRANERLYKGPSVCNTYYSCFSYIDKYKGYSFIFEEDILISTIKSFFTDSHGENKIRVARTGFYESQYATVLRKNHPIKHEYNKYILKIRQAGLVNLWRERHLHKKRLDNLKVHFDEHPDQLLDENEDEDKSLSIEHLQGAFLLYALGIGCSLLAYFYEKKKA